MILYGLIGKKLGHSFSAAYFNGKFAQKSIDARYELFEISSIEEISNLINSHNELKGLNVTIPYKQEVIPYLDRLTPVAEAIGAVNCIRIKRTEDHITLTGHNTDAGGFAEAIRPLLNNRKSALVLGLGGASKAVIYSLQALGIKVQGVSRTPGNGVITYSDLTKAVMSEHDIIVNTTPLGMWPNVDSLPDLPYDYIDEHYLCFDLVYNPEITSFMRRCAQQGAIVSNGLKMLYKQADLAYTFWNEYETSETVRKVSLMSRSIIVVNNAGEETYHKLSIADISLDDEDKVIDVIISPFEKEPENVRYVDSELRIIYGDRLPI